MLTADMASPWMQQPKEVSKLSKWLSLNQDDQQSSHLASNQFQTNATIASLQVHSNGGYSNFPFPGELSSNGTGPVNFDRANVNQWNVNASPFRPSSINLNLAAVNANNLNHQNVQPLIAGNSSSIPMPPFQNGGPSHQLVAGRQNQHQMDMGQQFGQANNLAAAPPLYPPRQQNFPPVSQFHAQTTFAQSQFDGANYPDNVWKDPNAELRRWQQYTGTSVWGEPAGQENMHIQRWQNYADEEFADMLRRRCSVAVNFTATADVAKEPLVGWGDLPPILSGVYGRIQQLQNQPVAAPAAPIFPPKNMAHQRIMPAEMGPVGVMPPNYGFEPLMGPSVANRTPMWAAGAGKQFGPVNTGSPLPFNGGRPTGSVLMAENQQMGMGITEFPFGGSAAGGGGMAKPIW